MDDFCKGSWEDAWINSQFVFFRYVSKTKTMVLGFGAELLGWLKIEVFFHARHFVLGDSAAFLVDDLWNLGRKQRTFVRR